METEKKELRRSSLERYRSAETSSWLLVAVHKAKRRILRRIAATVVAVAQSKPKGRAGILTYHRVAEISANAVKPTWNVTPSILRYQLEGLRQLGWEPIPLRALLGANATGETLPPKVMFLTDVLGRPAVSASRLAMSATSGLRTDRDGSSSSTGDYRSRTLPLRARGTIPVIPGRRSSH